MRRLHLLFAFLTTEANATVAPIHAKAMPVILTGEAADVVVGRGARGARFAGSSG